MSFIHREPRMGPSDSSNVNFLWKDDKRPIYIMDNHLCALWCWLEEIDEGDSYSLIHIDFHWDAAIGNSDALTHVSSFSDYLSREIEAGVSAVMYDNYIEPMTELRPEARDLFMLVHQRPLIGQWNGDGFSGEVNLRMDLDAVTLLRGFAPNGKVIVNLDLDYFFADGRLAFNEAWITELVGKLWMRYRDAVWTIAWSPECCGGWLQAAEISDLVCGILDVDFRAECLGPFPQ